MLKTKVIAHRGASAYAPENTFPAFKKALEMGAEGLELDVHLSKDGKLVVIHDERIDRTSNGSGYIKDLTLKKLKKLDFGNWFDQKFSGTSIPTLNELINLFKQQNWTGLLNIEIKNNLIIYPEIEEKVVKLIKNSKMENQIICSSFNHYCLKKIKGIDKQIKIAPLYLCGVEPWLYAKKIEAEALHPQFYNIIHRPQIVKECNERGIKLNLFTVNKEKDMKRLLKYKVNGIITNKPDLALKIRQSAK